ncbi:MAG TPA: lipopolysaccharide biosynthesis protein [Fulvivirga sp.]|nr:lipopolysaccharide biosynthesis protein [Fulvivirga sp.]
MSNLSKGFKYLLGGSALQSFFRIGITAILARILTPEDFGLLATAMIVTGFADLFVQFGFGQGLVQKKEIDQSDIGTAYTSSLILGVIFCILVLVLSHPLALYFKQPDLERILWLLSIIFPIKSFSQVQFSLLQKNKKFKVLAGRDAFSFVLGYGLISLVLAYFGYGVYSLVWGIIAQSIIYSILLSIGQNQYPLKFTFSKEKFNSLFNFGKNLTYAKIANYFALKGDYFVVSRIMGAENLGYYSRAYGLMNFPHSIIGNVLNTLLFVEFSDSQDNKEKLTSMVRDYLALLFFITGPVSLFAFILAPEIISILLGDQWTNTIIPFRILALVIVFKIGYKITGTLIKGIAKLERYAKIQVIYCFSVLLGAYFGSYYGLAGVALGTNIALIIMFSLLLQMVIENTNYKWIDFFKLVFNSTIYTFIVGIIPVIIYFTFSFIPLNEFSRLILISIIGGISFFGVTLNKRLAELLKFRLLYNTLKSIMSNLKLKNKNVR